MRYKVGALTLLLVILCGAVLNSFLVARTAENAAAFVRAAVNAERAAEHETAVRTAHALDEYWEGKRDYLESVLLHAELDDVNAALSDFISAAENDEQEAFYSCARLLTMRLSHLADLERLRIGNVL